ncbi:alpha/beta fold hydrolase [Caballeronia sp. LjRoot34]|uniref:alpha/beta fold hydrolase n=1 Tax=Caballeronia sp. LjRoot34 TaxID=3342325 RepID=UPI003ECF0472
MTQLQEKFLDLDGHQVAYVVTGPDPSIVLLHGIPTSRHLWRNVLGPLSEAGLNCVAPDLLGYGDSSKPESADLGIASQARIIEGLFQQLSWNGGVVVGHDIGGGVAQLLALNCPKYVRGLVLVDSIAYDSFPEPGIARLKEPVGDEILGAQGFDLRKGLAKGLRSGMAQQEKVTPELVAEYERPFQGVTGRQAYLRAARALRTEELSTRVWEIERLQMPTLLVWGAHDTFQPLPYGQRLAKAMPNAELEVIEEAGHFLPEDTPDRLAQLIIRFVKTRL